MCGFTCHLFGAHYPDAICTDGYMWDLDSIDDGCLVSGGDIPCPSCSTGAYLAQQASRAADDIPNPGDRSPAEFWEGTIRSCLKINPTATIAKLRSIHPFEMADWPGRVASRERIHPEFDDIIMRSWPWPMTGLSAHQEIAIRPK